MSRFVTNAEMSLMFLKKMYEKDGKELSQSQIDHFNKRYAPILDNIDNDIDDGFGFPRLTEVRDKK
jgi:hypothetical protein